MRTPNKYSIWSPTGRHIGIGPYVHVHEGRCKYTCTLKLVRRVLNIWRFEDVKVYCEGVQGMSIDLLYGIFG